MSFYKRSVHKMFIFLNISHKTKHLPTKVFLRNICSHNVYPTEYLLLNLLNVFALKELLVKLNYSLFGLNCLLCSCYWTLVLLYCYFSGSTMHSNLHSIVGSYKKVFQHVYLGLIQIVCKNLHWCVRIWIPHISKVNRKKISHVPQLVCSMYV